MIHKQQLPETEYRDLKRVFHVQIRLLLWILCKAVDIELERAAITQKFGPKVGRWLCVRIWKGAKKTGFGESIETLLAMAKIDIVQAKETAEAIWNDIQFVKKWDCPDYGLSFPGLPENWRQAVHGVCIPFYELWFRGTGYKNNVFDNSIGCLDRKCLLKAYRPNSNGVCSYCDGPLGDVGKTKEANDCEHFFPKSKFPHLCLHPCNLFVSCIGCNETWKIDNAPMGVADPAGLYGTYHPQLRPGIDSLSVDVGEEHLRSYKLTLMDNHVGTRVESLNSALDIDSRWTNYINERTRSVLSAFVAVRIDATRRFGAIDELGMKELIDNQIVYNEDKIGELPLMIREIAVLKYQEAHQLAELLLECA